MATLKAKLNKWSNKMDAVLNPVQFFRANAELCLRYTQGYISKEKYLKMRDTLRKLQLKV